jgi:hypothetical protein
MSKALFEMEQKMSIINNYPPDFKMERHYPDYLERRGGGGIPIKRSEPLTDAEREAEAIAFAWVDEYDRRNRGQEFES